MLLTPLTLPIPPNHTKYCYHRIYENYSQGKGNLVLGESLKSCDNLIISLTLAIRRALHLLTTTPTTRMLLTRLTLPIPHATQHKNRPGILACM